MARPPSEQAGGGRLLPGARREHRGHRVHAARVHVERHRRHGRDPVRGDGPCDGQERHHAPAPLVALRRRQGRASTAAPRTPRSPRSCSAATLSFAQSSSASTSSVCSPNAGDGRIVTSSSNATAGEWVHHLPELRMRLVDHHAGRDARRCRRRRRRGPAPDRTARRSREQVHRPPRSSSARGTPRRRA